MAATGDLCLGPTVKRNNAVAAARFGYSVPMLARTRGWFWIAVVMMKARLTTTVMVKKSGHGHDQQNSGALDGIMDDERDDVHS